MASWYPVILMGRACVTDRLSARIATLGHPRQ